MRRKLFIYLFAVMLILPCMLFGSGEKGTTEGEEEITVAFISPAMDIEWFMWMGEGAKAKAEELGVKVIITDANYDNDKMLSDLRNAIAMGAQAVSTILMDDATGPAFKEICDEAGVYLIASDTPIEGALYLGADNYYCGELVGKWAADYIIENYKAPQDIPLIVMLDLPQFKAVVDRCDGFLAPIVEKVPAFDKYTLEELRKNKYKDIVVNYDSGYTREDSENVMRDIITANPRDAYIVFAGNDDSNAAGAALALEAAGLGDKSIVVGQSGSGEVFLRMIADPNSCFTATTSYFPDKQAAALVDAMVRLVKGEKLTNKDIEYTEHTVTTKENVKSQYPDIFK
jgi:fructose transport system substrate-binding protein